MGAWAELTKGRLLVQLPLYSCPGPGKGGWAPGGPGRPLRRLHWEGRQGGRKWGGDPESPKRRSLSRDRWGGSQFWGCGVGERGGKAELAHWGRPPCRPNVGLPVCIWVFGKCGCLVIQNQTCPLGPAACSPPPGLQGLCRLTDSSTESSEPSLPFQGPPSTLPPFGGFVAPPAP